MLFWEKEAIHMKKKTLVVNILFALSVTAFVPIDNMQAAEFVEDSNNNFEIDQNNTLVNCKLNLNNHNQETHSLA